MCLVRFRRNFIIFYFKDHRIPVGQLGIPIVKTQDSEFDYDFVFHDHTSIELALPVSLAPSETVCMIR